MASAGEDGSGAADPNCVSRDMSVLIIPRVPIGFADYDNFTFGNG
jgi:hypothetical protein